LQRHLLVGVDQAKDGLAFLDRHARLEGDVRHNPGHLREERDRAACGNRPDRFDLETVVIDGHRRRHDGRRGTRVRAARTARTARESGKSARTGPAAGTPGEAAGTPSRGRPRGEVGQERDHVAVVCVPGTAGDREDDDRQ